MVGRCLGIWASTFLLLPGNSPLKCSVASWAPVSLFHLRELSHRWKVGTRTLLCQGSLDGMPEPNLVQRQVQRPHAFCLMGLCVHGQILTPLLQACGWHGGLQSWAYLWMVLWVSKPTGMGNCARVMGREGDGPRSLGVPAALSATGSRPWHGAGWTVGGRELWPTGSWLWQQLLILFSTPPRSSSSSLFSPSVPGQMDRDWGFSVCLLS